MGRVRLLLLAVAGAVCGHVVSYGLVFPERAARQSVLRLTGHAYWHAAIGAAIVGGAWFVATHAARHFRAGRRRQPFRTDIAGLFPRLALLQIAVFIGMEMSERAAVGAPLSTVLDHRILLIGVSVQLAVALLLAAASHALGRAAHTVGGHFAERDARPRAVLSFIPPVALAPRLLAVAPCGSRGPPLS
ncbi:MAG TPA: hypothetical protein VFB78_14450 [Acidimicrobiales bacterium]|nr:hypothetical protein [Acidimicrobiales bacterium]